MLTFDFIYNDGSRRHRGVWHMVDGTLEYEHVPEKVTVTTPEIRDWHTDRCALTQRTYDYRSGQYRLGDTCDCGHTGEVIGTYTKIDIKPAHTIARAEKVACNQVGSLSTGGLKHSWANFYKKHKVGEVVTTKDGVIKPLAVTATEFPAGPWCSRCQTKMDEKQALSDLQMEQMWEGR